MSTTEIQRSPREQLADAIKKALPSIRGVAASMVDPQRIARLAVMCADENDLLYRCTPVSIVRAIMKLAEVGIEPGSALNEGYIVPRKDKDGNWTANAQVSAYGFAALAYRSGKVRALWWEPVYQGDEFSVSVGSEPQIAHVPRMDGNESDANLTHVYAVAKLESATVFKVLSRTQIEKLKNANPSVKKGNYSPWTDWYSEMACAKVVKALCKRLPKSREVAVAMHIDDMAEAGKPDALDAEWSEANGGNKALGVEAVAEKLGVKKGSDLANGKKHDSDFDPEGPTVKDGPEEPE